VNDALRAMLAILDELGLRYFAVGSVASSIHGVPRFTNDVDLLVELNEGAVNQIAVRAGETFYIDPDEAKRALRMGRAFNLLHLASASKIDVFPLGRDEFHRSELARAAEQEWVVPGQGSIRLRVASAEDTVLSKLRWYKMGGMVSDRQWSDILGVASRADLDWSYLREWAPRTGVAELLERVFLEARSILPG
jgi:hypothetical protein